MNKIRHLLTITGALLLLLLAQLPAQTPGSSASVDTGSGAPNTVTEETITDPNGHQVPATANAEGNSAGSGLPSANNAGLGTENIAEKTGENNSTGNWGLLGLLGFLGLLKLRRTNSRERID